jgi:hypothetical protein
MQRDHRDRKQVGVIHESSHRWISELSLSCGQQASRTTRRGGNTRQFSTCLHRPLNPAALPPQVLHLASRRPVP